MQGQQVAHWAKQPHPFTLHALKPSHAAARLARPGTPRPAASCGVNSRAARARRGEEVKFLAKVRLECRHPRGRLRRARRASPPRDKCWRIVWRVECCKSVHGSARRVAFP